MIAVSSVFGEISRPAAGKLLSVPIDNEFIQSYRGRIGRWILPGSEKLEDTALEMGTTVAEIKKINDSIQKKGPVFVPMSEDVYNTLLAKGYGRRIIQVDERRYIWPVESPSYSSRFGPRGHGVHYGLDMPCARNTVVVAANDGEVVQAAWLGGMGLAIIIKHSDGIESRYAHNQTLLVKVGDKIRRGQIISRSGSTGLSTGPHVHFELRYMDVPLDPEDFLPYGYRNPELVIRESPGSGLVSAQKEMVFDEVFRP